MQKIVTVKNILPSDESTMKEYFTLSREINLKYHKELINDNKSFENFIKKITKKLQITKDCHLYLIYLNGTPTAWVDFTIWGKELYYYIYVNGDILDKEVLKWIFSKNLELMQNYKADKSYLYSYMQSVLNAFEDENIPVHEKMILSMLNREDMNQKQYDKITADTSIDGLNFGFYEAVPDEFMDSFLDCLHNGYCDLNRLKEINETYPKLTPKQWKDDKKNLKERGINLLIGVLTENNIVAGICWVIHFEENKKAFRHDGGFTSISKQYRGKGLARFMKAKLYEHLLKVNKDFTHITTDTMPYNKYMYKINEEFGFKPFKNGAAFMLDKNFFENFLEINN